MMAGWLAICGIPIWAGFFSKDEILYKTFAAANLPEPWNYVLWGIGIVTAFMTAVYMTRMMWMTFYGDERYHAHVDDAVHESEPPAADEIDEHGAAEADAAHDVDDAHHALPHDFKPHESPWSMTAPLVVLAVLSTVGGLVGVPYALSGGAVPNVFEHTLEPVIAKVGRGREAPGASKPHAVLVEDGLSELYASAEAPKLGAAATSEEHEAHSPEELRSERLLAGLSVLVALGGIGLGIALFGKAPLRKLPRILVDKWRIDELYNGYVVDPITRLSTDVLWRGFDLGFIDGIVNGIGHFLTGLGDIFRRVQVGFVRSYAAFILLGAVLLVGYFIYYGLKLVG